jgi:hypothetical protein
MTNALEGFSINPLLDERDAARVLSCSIAVLRKWRLLRKGPAYCRVGRLVRYRKSDLVAYLQANRVEPAAGGVR